MEYLHEGCKRLGPGDGGENSTGDMNARLADTDGTQPGPCLSTAGHDAYATIAAIRWQDSAQRHRLVWPHRCLACIPQQHGIRQIKVVQHR